MGVEPARLVAHVDMDAFYAAVERLDQPELAGRPIIVGGGQRGVVSAASYEARRYGVRSAMPMFQARSRCPQGVFLPPRMERYVQVSRQIMEVLAGFSPLVEPVSVDEAYLDLGGTARLWGPPGPSGARHQAGGARGHGTHLFGGPGAGALLGQDRQRPGQARRPHRGGGPGGLLGHGEPGRGARGGGAGPGAPGGHGPHPFDRGARPWGPSGWSGCWGVFGRRLWELAWGRDDTPVSPGREVKSISNERTLSQDTGDRELLAAHLLGLSQKVARRLRRKGLAGRTVTLKLKHFDHRLVTRAETLDQASDAAEDIYAAVHRLLRAYAPPGPFRLIGVGVSGLAPRGSGQAGLFPAPTQGRRRALGRAEDAIVARFGEKALTRAGSLGALGSPLDHKPAKGHNRDEPK